MATSIRLSYWPLEQPSGDRRLDPMKHVLLLKYGAGGLAIILVLTQKWQQGGMDAVVNNLTNPSVIRHITAIGVAVLAFAWMLRDHAAVGLLVMSAVLADSVVKVSTMGLYFVNHYLLQAVIGLVGMLAAGRQLAGHASSDAWRPLRTLGVMVWGLAAAKKLLHGSYLDGDFMATKDVSARRTSLQWFTSNVLVPDDTSIPQRCCESVPLDVSLFAAASIVVLGVLLVTAELIPVGLALRSSTRSMVGWAILVLTMIATILPAEFDFGLTNLMFAALWGEGRAFRRTTLAMALLFAALFTHQLALTPSS